jgi:hypothetical protein
VRHEKRSVAALHEHLKNETGADFCHLQREVEIQTHSIPFFSFIVNHSPSELTRLGLKRNHFQ